MYIFRKTGSCMIYGFSAGLWVWVIGQQGSINCGQQTKLVWSVGERRATGECAHSSPTAENRPSVFGRPASYSRHRSCARGASLCSPRAGTRTWMTNQWLASKTTRWENKNSRTARQAAPALATGCSLQLRSCFPTWTWNALVFNLLLIRHLLAEVW